MMTIAQIMEKMIAFSEGNIHDITHLSCVWTYAKTIGELEGLDADTQFILEVAAITHDIANGFGIGPHAAQVRDVMDIPFGKGDHLFHDLCNGHHLFHSRF
jgi:HD superfamily phosphohydrolase YqeK